MCSKKKRNKNEHIFSEMSQLPPWFSPNHPGISGSLDFFSLTSGIWRLRPCHLGVLHISHFFLKRNHVEKPTHITDTLKPSKNSQKYEFKRSHQKPTAKTRCQCENFHLVALQLKKHPFLGTPNIGFTPVGSKPWALANGKANSPLNISSTCPPQSAVFVKDSKKLERNLGELVNQNPNTSLPTPELSRQSITNLTFFWHHRTSPHLVVLVHFHQLQQLCDLTADLSSWFGLKK